LHLEAATIALFGSAVLMLYARSDVEEILREVEWPTLLFFVGLFALVGGLEVTGFVGRIAEFLTGIGSSLALTAMLVMWGSAAASERPSAWASSCTTGIMVAVNGMLSTIPEAAVRPLWWALAIGADFGGNFTLIGASANVVVAGMSERAGRRITFLQFLAYGIPVTLVSLAVATPYVLLRYYL
jgi:Na+/H+ antiporter NhaD/arsenite permease-like protein